MGEWREITLGTLCADVSGAIAIGPFGSRMKADCYVPNGVPVIRGTNISDSRAWKGDWVYVSDETADSMLNCNVTCGDLVFPHRGSIGEVAIVPSDETRYMLSTSLMKFTANRNKAHPLFLFYYFRSPNGRHEILRFSSQVGTPGIGQPLSSLKQFRVLLPPPREQEAIAGLLSALDDKIALNRRMNATLEAMARALFKDWFVDFGPTRAKAEGRPPYLAPDLWALFPDALDDDDKPVGWKFSTLAAVAALNPETWSRANAPEAIEYVDLANTKWGVIESTQRHMWAKAPSRAQRIIRPGDTIVGTVRPGNGSYAFVGDDGLTGSTGFAALRPLHVRFREFVYLAATSAENIERLSHLADGAAYPAVRPDVVAETDVTLPSNSVMDSFSRLIAPLVERWEVNKRENQTLAHTRDLLLPKLMSGEIRLRDAEKAVEAVA